MLEKDSTYIMNCDFCANYFETDEEDFNAAVAEAKAKGGYKVFKVGSSWLHKCPVCQEAERQKELEEISERHAEVLDDSKHGST